MAVTRYEVTDRMIHIEEVDAAGGNRLRSIPVEALASWGELLGLDDPAETLAAIIHVQDHGEPDVDPVTGENSWTPAYEALYQAGLPQPAPAAAVVVVDDMVAARSFSKATTLSQVDQARNVTRGRLGLPLIPDVDAVDAPEMSSFATLGVETEVPSADLLQTIVAGLPGELLDGVLALTDVIDARRAEFLERVRPPAAAAG